MQSFWHFTKEMRRYWARIATALVAALLDAACAFAGFSALLAVIRMLFEEGRGVKDALLEKLQNPEWQAYIGDQTHLAEFIPADPFGGFVWAMGYILVLALFGSVMRYTHQAQSIMVSLRIVARIRQQAFHRLLHAKGEYLSRINTTDNLSRIVLDSSRLSAGFTALMGRAVRDLFTGMAFLMGAFISDWRLTLIFLIGMPFIAIVIRKFGKKIRKAGTRTLEQYASMTGAVNESIQGISVVRVHNAEGYERRRFNTINRIAFQQEMKARTYKALSSPVIELIALVGVMAVSIVAAYFAFRMEGGDPASMVTVLIWLGLAGASFKPLANLNNTLQEAAAGADRLMQVMDAPVEPNLRGDRSIPDLKRHQRDLVFEGVGYQYPGAEEPAIGHVDLEVKHGESVAIVGTNGSGKSTLLNLVPRLAEPTQGKVLIDGVDIAGVSLKSLRKQIAVVTQQTILFEGTIADNIAYGRRHEPREKIEAAAKMAFADEFVRVLPKGYDTQLGEGGAGLSGGQKQRLCIARAILRNPAILILDEATSQIDAESEAKITDAIDALRTGRTTLIIAHRLSTVVDCDRIVVMNDGRIVDRGKHRELLERCGVYQTLVRNQLGGGDAISMLSGTTPGPDAE